MMKIGIGINCWDEPQGVLRILQGKNVYEFFDNIIIIEGRYKGRSDEAEKDGRIMDEIPQSFNKVIYERLENVIQIEKRNRYLEIAGTLNLDWLVVCDTDEYLEIEDPKVFRKFLEEHYDYPARIFPLNNWVEKAWRMARPRLLKNPGGLRHKQNTSNMISHGKMYDEKGRMVITDMYIYHKETRGEYKYVPGIYQTHLKKGVRSRERSIRDEVYYAQNPTR